VLHAGGFWAGGGWSVPLVTVRDVRLEADASGRGTVTFVAASEGTRELSVADAPAVHETLVAAAAAARARR
jgi:hypothetical protein